MASIGKPYWRALLIACIVLDSTSLVFGEIERKVLVSYTTQSGWSSSVVKDVVFLSGTELNIKTSGTEYGRYLRGSVYALVWFDTDEVAICEQNPPAPFVQDPVDQERFRQLLLGAFKFPDLRQVNTDGNRTWRFQGRNKYGQAIDPRER